MINYVAKSMFLDRAKVMAAVERAKLRVLNRAGSMTRITMRRMIRKRKGHSAAGSPPHSHGQHLLRNKIFYGYDSSADSVVIGPEKLAIKGNVPEVLEFGGSVDVKESRLSGGRWMQSRFVKDRDGRPERVRKVDQEPRPFAAPSLEAIRPKLAGLWLNSVR